MVMAAAAVSRQNLTAINVTTPAGAVRPVLAFTVPPGPMVQRRGPSHRYAGLVVCARRALGFGDEERLACRLTALGTDTPDCDGGESYLPLAVGSRNSV